MNWWEWVFSGIGVLGLSLLIGWWKKRSKSSAPQAAITAQGAKVSGSPVASGTGITQTISETHHHHYPQASTQPAQPAPALSAELAATNENEEPKPNLKIVGGRKILVHEGLDEAFYESQRERATGQGVVVNVTNDAVKGKENTSAIVKATLLYHDEGEEVLRVMGTWLETTSGLVRFDVDDSHGLILGLVINERFFVPSKRRIANRLGDVAFVTDPNYLECDRTIVTVRLTDADAGDVYCEEQFEIVPNPLSITATRQQ